MGAATDDFATVRWADTHVTWSFAQQTFQEDQSLPFSNAITGPWQSIIHQAFARWASVSGLTFEQIPDSADHAHVADIRIGWGDFGPTATTIGLTAYSYDDGMLDPGVVVRLEDPAERPVVTDASGTATYIGTSSALYSLALHEIGHALGLDHSSDPVAVMNPRLTAGNRDLAPSDILNIQNLYQDSAAKLFLVTDTTSMKQAYYAGSTYSGPVDYLQYSYVSSTKGTVVGGTAFNDFIKGSDADDAINAGAGNDVLDGGAGSNFLTGGAGHDVFFLDGRGAAATWSTIADWEAGEEMVLWGWHPGRSKAHWVDNDGVGQYRGVTLHADLDGNGVTDASVTWTGHTQAELSKPVEMDGLLWFR